MMLRWPSHVYNFTAASTSSWSLARCKFFCKWVSERDATLTGRYSIHELKADSATLTRNLRSKSHRGNSGGEDEVDDNESKVTDGKVQEDEENSVRTYRKVSHSRGGGIKINVISKGLQVKRCTGASSSEALTTCMVQEIAEESSNRDGSGSDSNSDSDSDSESHSNSESNSDSDSSESSDRSGDSDSVGDGDSSGGSVGEEGGSSMSTRTQPPPPTSILRIPGVGTNFAVPSYRPGVDVRGDEVPKNKPTFADPTKSSAMKTTKKRRVASNVRFQIKST